MSLPDLNLPWRSGTSDGIDPWTMVLPGTATTDALADDTACGVALRGNGEGRQMLLNHDPASLHIVRELQRQVQERTTELAASRLEVIHCLGRAAEYRDNDTGWHVIRVGLYAGIVARQLGLDPVLVEEIEHAAPLHDVGKIGIPDSVLLKPGKLTEEEFAIIRRHCEIGKRIVSEMSGDEWWSRARATAGETVPVCGPSPTLEMAGRIAMSHHEKWDGSGYPMGLAGEAIPLEGRITAVADVFDALSNQRPYKPAFSLEHCFKILEEGRGKHFDPRVLDAFFAGQDKILRIREQCPDSRCAASGDPLPGNRALAGQMESSLNEIGELVKAAISEDS